MCNNFSKSKKNYIDDDFISALGRISGALERDDYFAAIEQANRVNALSKFTSFSKENSFVNTYASVIFTTLRDVYLRDVNLNHINDIGELFHQLQLDPTNEKAASELLILLKDHP